MSDFEDGGQGWPPVTYEELPWTIDPQATASRAALRKHRGPYSAAVLAAIATEEVHLPQTWSQSWTMLVPR
ncbi:MAG TPA: hypothetical protein VL068_12105 [Microthrixaceae bacterium]|nr:hypothetical protein [Microthrixaceae bacterium]